MYEPVFSRPLWPAVHMQYIFPVCRASGWVYLQSPFINPGLFCLKYPTDWSHSWHPFKQRLNCFYGLIGFDHRKFLALGNIRESWIRKHESHANCLNSRNYFTTTSRFIFGHEELEAQICFVSQDIHGHLYFKKESDLAMLLVVFE